LIHHSPKKQQVLPHHDPYWEKEVEVEMRDLAIYEQACSSQSFVNIEVGHA